MIINILLIVLIIVLAFILICYNNLVKLNNKVKEEESGIDILLKQRFDLIPNIIETVKGYSDYESDTLAEIIRLRNDYSENKGFNVEEAEKLNNKMNNFIARVEAYPDLKANSQYQSLQENLREIEDKLEYRRTRYNRAVTMYNNKIETIPSEFIAKLFNFERKELFKLENKEEKGNIKVDLKK